MPHLDENDLRYYIMNQSNLDWVGASTYAAHPAVRQAVMGSQNVADWGHDGVVTWSPPTGNNPVNIVQNGGAKSIAFLILGAAIIWKFFLKN